MKDTVTTILIALVGLAVLAGLTFWLSPGLVPNQPVESHNGAELQKAVQQLTVALDQARSRQQTSSLQEIRESGQRVINVLEGSSGPDFDDSVGNPGDGHGARTYLIEVLNLIQAPQLRHLIDEAAAAGGLDVNQGQLMAILNMVFFRVAQSIESAKLVLSDTDLDQAQQHLQSTTALLQTALGTGDASSREGIRFLQQVLAGL